MESAPTVTRFDTYREFRAALLEVIGRAQRELRIFDPDLRETGLETPAGIEALVALLRSGRHHTAHILVHDPEPIERHFARLRALQQQFSHAIEIRQTPDHLRQLSEVYAIADSACGVLRFHRDQARGRLFLDDRAECERWRIRFQQVWEISHPVATGTRLGL